MATTLGGTETVLVVEDAEPIRELARRLLEVLGYTVLVAANAEEASSLEAAHPVLDVLVTDVVMPEGNGPDLAVRLLERRPGLAVVYMSGYTVEVLGELGAGIHFLQKPFTSETLGRTIREALEDRPQN
jgi:DNA-binding NtrC family response regulator